MKILSDGHSIRQTSRSCEEKCQVSRIAIQTRVCRLGRAAHVSRGTEQAGCRKIDPDVRIQASSFPGLLLHNIMQYPFLKTIDISRAFNLAHPYPAEDRKFMSFPYGMEKETDLLRTCLSWDSGDLNWQIYFQKK